MSEARASLSRLWRTHTTWLGSVRRPDVSLRVRLRDGVWRSIVVGATAGAVVAVIQSPGPPVQLRYAPLLVTPAPSAPVPSPRADRSVRRPDPLLVALHRVAMCESHDNPGDVSSSGRYRGMYQFDLVTWHSVGGSGDPARASRGEQTYRAILLYRSRGWSPWPVCGRGPLK